MPDNNGDNAKECPIIRKECIGDKCELRAILNTGQGTMQVCAFNALVLILSDMNMKANQRTIQLPKGYRG